MKDEQTGHQRNWTTTLRAAVAMGAADGVTTVFSTLLWQDGERISVRARAFLEQFAPSYFAEEDLSGAMLEHRLRMDMFNASVIAYLDGRGASIELEVGNDIATWIEANAPAVVSANLSLMEQALGRPGVETHRDVVRLHGLIDLQTYEQVQQHYLETTWAEIERSLADVMAAAAR